MCASYLCFEKAEDRLRESQENALRFRPSHVRGIGGVVGLFEVEELRLFVGLFATLIGLVLILC